MHSHKNSPKKALMVEDEDFIQEYFHNIFKVLGSEWVLHCVSTGQEAIDYLQIGADKVDLILVDIGLPDISGHEVIKAAYAARKGTPIIVMTTFASEDNFIAAIRAGASGYLLKSENQTTILNSLDQVLRGNYPVSPSLARHLFKLSGSPVLRDPTKTLKLSAREVELLGHLSQGLSYAQSADVMTVALSTVQSHIRNIYRKLNVSNQTQALNKARDAGAIT